MAWTYAGNPSASPVDMTHFRMGDTDPSNPIATDEECATALCENGQNTYLAAASLLETKALQFAMRPTQVKKGDNSTSYGDASQAFLTTAKMLRMNASLDTATVYAGGISLGNKAANRGDSDTVPPFARKDLPTPFRFGAGWEDLEREP